jgi:hypothetical protein
LHRYETPGAYTVTLRVTDPTGQEATTTAAVAIHVAPVEATTAGAGAGSAISETPADTLAPVLSRLTVTPRRFRLGSRLPRLAANARTGAAIRFNLSEPATVTLRFSRVLPRRRSMRVPWTIRLRGRQGPNTVRFQGRLARRRALRPGRYRVTVSARDATGHQARPLAARFDLLTRAR